MGNPSVHGIHVGQNVTQARIRDIAGNEFVDRREKRLGMGEDRRGVLAQIEHPHLFRKAVESLDIASDSLCLTGKQSGKIIDELFPSARDGIVFVLLEIAQ